MVLFIAGVDEVTGESNKQLSSSPIAFQDLVTSLELDEADLIPAIKFWLNKGVIRETTGHAMLQDQAYLIIEEQRALAAFDEEQRVLQQQQNSLHHASSFNSQLLPMSSSSMDYDSYAQLQNQDAMRRKMAMKLVEDYIKSLLKGHGSLTIDRLFTSLQLLLQAAMTENTTLTTKDFAFVNQIMSLKQLLQSINEVDCLEGVYSLRQQR